MYFLLRLSGCVICLESNNCDDILNLVRRRYSSVISDCTDTRFDIRVSLSRTPTGVRLELNEQAINLMLDSRGFDLGSLIPIVVSHLRPNFLILHCSSLLVGGKAVLFVGSSTSGKTTISQWMNRQYGFPVLADDLVSMDVSQGSIYPWFTPPNLRPYTQFKILQCGKVSPIRTCLSDMEAPVQLSHLFLLQPVGGKEIPIQPGIGWAELYELCSGQQARNRDFSMSKMRLHKPVDFMMGPELCKASCIESIRSLYRHSYPPNPPLRDTISHFGAVFSSIQSFCLVPGHIEETGDALLKVLA